jgi:RNA polymerase sigma-70 factor (ECF subfamily)
MATAARTAAVTEQGLADEQAWVERARQADAAAFESLYRLHVDKIYGLCLRMTGNAFSTWMHRIAVNSVLGRMRKSRREQDRIEAVTDISPVPESVGDSANFEDLQQAVDELPDRARHVFVLHAVYGYSHDETGEMLGIATGTSKAQLHRAKRLLARQLKQSGYES